MRIGSKALIKWSALFCTLFQGFAIFKGQEFHPLWYAGAIMTLFGTNSAHENIEKYLSKGDGQ